VRPAIKANITTDAAPTPATRSSISYAQVDLRAPHLALLDRLVGPARDDLHLLCLLRALLFAKFLVVALVNISDRTFGPSEMKIKSSGSGGGIGGGD
jgi:hypothetical protein